MKYVCRLPMKLNLTLKCHLQSKLNSVFSGDIYPLFFTPQMSPEMSPILRHRERHTGDMSKAILVCGSGVKTSESPVNTRVYSNSTILFCGDIVGDITATRQTLDTLATLATHPYIGVSYVACRCRSEKKIKKPTEWLYFTGSEFVGFCDDEAIFKL